MVQTAAGMFLINLYGAAGVTNIALHRTCRIAWKTKLRSKTDDIVQDETSSTLWKQRQNILYSISEGARDVLTYRAAISHSCKKHEAIIKFCDVFGDKYGKFNFDNTQ